MMRPSRSGSARGLRSASSPPEKATPPSRSRTGSSLPTRRKSRASRALPLTLNRDDLDKGEENIDRISRRRSKEGTHGTNENSRKSPIESLQKAVEKQELLKEEHQPSFTTETVQAIYKDKKANVTIILQGVVIKKSSDIGSVVGQVMGNDGNQFYCEICKGFGDVICCDGCPKVYHAKCIPMEDLANTTLGNDDEPWFCPKCKDDKVKEGTPGTRISRKRRRLENNLVTEEPERSSVRRSTGTERRSTSKHAELEEEEGMPIDSKDDEESNILPKIQPLTKRARRLRSRSAGENEIEGDDISVDHSPIEDEEESDMEHFGDSPELKRKKRKRSDSEVTNSAKKEKKKSLLNTKRKKKNNEKKKKKKKKKKRSDSMDEEVEVRNLNDEDRSSGSRLNHRGLVQAMPAFFFFLTDAKIKIERSLARKHRYFNRLPKGLERNELIAREGALMWIKLPKREQRRYFSLSMRDFEAKVIEWKEEKVLREMANAQDPDDRYMNGRYDDDAKDYSPEDEMGMHKRHQRLYLSTSVGSKPFAPEVGKSNNRILLELLQDMRFHPMPMFNPLRTDNYSGMMDRSKISIPYFDVQGPVSTSAGDECSGCTRGWNHFCPVLKRRIPAVENRARLQPPMSSLMATRIGLGLKTIIPEAHEEVDGRNSHLFVPRLTNEAQQAKRVPPIPSSTLTNPMGRADDVVCFVEECLAMKVPEPPRPVAPIMSPEPKKKKKKSLLSRGTLPIRSRRKSNESNDHSSPFAEFGDDPHVHSHNNSNSGLNKCGRCRTIIENDTGCIQCRRAQLVINTSKKSLAAGEKKADLKVQTTMIGRLTVKENNFESQEKSDRDVANAIIRLRWMPSAVLPPEKTYIPTHNPNKSKESTNEDDQTSHNGENDANGDSQEETRNNKESIDKKPIENAKKVRTPEKASRHPNTIGEIDDESGKNNRSSRRRIRSTRAIGASMNPDDMDIHMTPDRQAIAQKHKDEATELSKRCLNVACCGILLAMIRRDPLCLFAEPVPANIVGYSKLVTNPIDFGKIKSRIQREKYSSLGAFLSDARLLCQNALGFNPPGSIYSKTAKELQDVLDVMQKRAVNWISTIKDAHASFYAWRGGADKDFDEDNDPFKELRKTWPEGVDMLENGDWLQEQVSADFMRTKENEAAYYGSIAVRRAAAAAESSLAPYTDSIGIHSTVIRRSHTDDENLRRLINTKVAQLDAPIQLKDIPRWREESILRTLRRVQSRRVEGRIMSDSGCARCDGIRTESKMALTAVRWGRNKRKGEVDTVPRVADSRLSLTTGLGSKKIQKQIGRKLDGIEVTMKSSKMEVEEEEEKLEEEGIKHKLLSRSFDETDAEDAKNTMNVDAKDDKWDKINEVAVTVRGSGIHGWGLFADQPFKKGDVVAEYVGEYISNAVADAREKIYQERRIQDYQFRVDENLVIDATLKGGHGRYINHNCNPNCVAKIMDSKQLKDNGSKHLKRVMIIAQRDIKALEEITYDYQFPLELDLDARIPCNCGSLLCRGFMNWDLPEKGSKNRVLRTQKRGGNMRDRIRRLGRPLKKQDL